MTPLTSLPPGLAARNAIADHDHVASRLVFEGSGGDAAPLVTIAIPTFRRRDLLVETVKSVLAQNFTRPFDIVVVDNDPESTGADTLVAALPELRKRAFRYYVNAENIGMYPNHNRCLALARGTWASILNDDDLLLPDFLSTMFDELDRRPAIKGLVARKQWLDERKADAAKPPPRMFMAGYHLWLESHFLGRQSRRIAPSAMFWGVTVGNLAGFVFRRDAALALGGFQPEDELSADYWFYTRFAVLHGLYQHRAMLGLVRVARNESMRPDVLRSFIAQGVRMRRALVGHAVPRWYARFDAMMIAREQAAYRTFWGVDIPREELERNYNVRLPPNRPWMYHALRFSRL
jgi:glycosyltransferase involved in cell wall biosynthesis